MLLAKTFHEAPKGEEGGVLGGTWKMAASGAPFYAENSADAESERHKQLVDVKRSSRDDLFQFISMIIQAEIALDLTHAIEQNESLISLDATTS